MTNISVSVSAVQKPAGFDNSQGIITAVYRKDSTDKRWDGDAELKVWRDWMTKYMPGGTAVCPLSPLDHLLERNFERPLLATLPIRASFS